MYLACLERKSTSHCQSMFDYFYLMVSSNTYRSVLCNLYSLFEELAPSPTLKTVNISRFSHRSPSRSLLPRVNIHIQHYYTWFIVGFLYVFSFLIFLFSFFVHLRIITEFIVYILIQCSLAENYKNYQGIMKVIEKPADISHFCSDNWQGWRHDIVIIMIM